MTLSEYKRTLYAEWGYSKQAFLHLLYVDYNDYSAFFAQLPKPDSSHGFPWRETPSRYGQVSRISLGGCYAKLHIEEINVAYK
mmetsp:Transcript_7551/g.14051  ORF Transcript_7551/g.14051 Transcript_7551/m.14051 type:complete len:83 (-) Transcript_7551:2765-3013(-)